MLLTGILGLILIPSISSGYDYNTEDWHVRQWCTDGQVEYRNSDGTRVDCLLDDYAIEFDFAHKYAEAISQSLHYAIQTKKKAGVVLIMTNKKSKEHLYRLNKIIETYCLPITVWVMKAVYK